MAMSTPQTPGNAGDYIMVQLNDGNVGAHPVNGRHAKYGYRKHGEQFLMHKLDVELYPHKVIVLGDEPAQAAPAGEPTAGARAGVKAEVKTGLVVESEVETAAVPAPEPAAVAVTEPAPQPVLKSTPSPLKVSNLPGFSPTVLAHVVDALGSDDVYDLVRRGKQFLVRVDGVGERTADKLMGTAEALVAKNARSV